MALVTKNSILKESRDQVELLSEPTKIRFWPRKYRKQQRAQNLKFAKCRIFARAVVRKQEIGSKARK